MFRYVVLGLLRRGDAQHGYGLMKLYRERSGLQLSGGSFYRELQRLMNDGLVELVVGMRQSDKRRAPYRITAEGETAFDEWLNNVMNRAPTGCDDRLGSRALFIGEHPAKLVRGKLEDWQKELWLESKLLERRREVALNRLPRTSADRPFDLLSLLIFRRWKHVAADIQFLEEFQDEYLAYHPEIAGSVAPETSETVEPMVSGRDRSRRSWRESSGG